MSHYDSLQWSDFVRGLVKPDIARAMSKHLEDGCAACAGVESMIRRVSRLASADRAAQPPPAAVRLAKALFAVHASEPGPSVRSLAMRLVGDGRLRPAEAGLRNGPSEGRALTYRGSDLSLELQVLPRSSGDEALLVGELSSDSAGPLGGVPAFVVSWGRVTSHASTDERGRFALTRSRRCEARLCLAVEDGAMVSLRLPGGDEPGEA